MPAKHRPAADRASPAPSCSSCSFWLAKTPGPLALAFTPSLKILPCSSVQFSSVAQSCLTLRDPWTAARQASLSITNSQSLLKLMSIKLVMPSSHLILCHPLLLVPPTPPSIRAFSNESTLPMRWPKYWTFSFSIIPSKEIPGLISVSRKSWR